MHEKAYWEDLRRFQEAGTKCAEEFIKINKPTRSLGKFFSYVFDRRLRIGYAAAREALEERLFLEGKKSLN